MKDDNDDDDGWMTRRTSTQTRAYGGTGQVGLEAFLSYAGFVLACLLAYLVPCLVG